MIRVGLLLLYDKSHCRHSFMGMQKYNEFYLPNTGVALCVF
jgi:hypothetical protein